MYNNIILLLLVLLDFQIMDKKYKNKLMDNIFTSCLEENYQSGVLINNISDHLPVFYMMSCDIAVACIWQKQEMYVYSACNIDDSSVSMFVDKLSDVKWNVDNTDVNTSYTSFLVNS